MSLEIFDQLETKIDALCDSLSQLKEENEGLKAALSEKDQRLEAMTAEKDELQVTVDSLQGSSSEHQNKLETVTERIQGIIEKLETVA